MPNDLRLELRARNNVLWHAIFDVYSSVAEFCRVHKLDEVEVGRLLNLKSSPLGKKGAFTAQARHISDAVGIHPDELFPASLYEHVLPMFEGRPRVAEVASCNFTSLASAEKMALPPSQHESLEHEYRMREVASALEIVLTPRERQVIQDRFGLCGEDPVTLLEMSSRLGLSRQLVAQIETEAMQKLRGEGWGPSVIAARRLREVY